VIVTPRIFARLAAIVFLAVILQLAFFSRIPLLGSVANVAGVCNERGNVFGLMPHPEHAVEPRIGGTDGAVLLGSLIDAVAAGGAR